MGYENYPPAIGHQQSQLLMLFWAASEMGNSTLRTLVLLLVPQSWILLPCTLKSVPIPSAHPPELISAPLHPEISASFPPCTIPSQCQSQLPAPFGTTQPSGQQLKLVTCNKPSPVKLEMVLYQFITLSSARAKGTKRTESTRTDPISWLTKLWAVRSDFVHFSSLWCLLSTASTCTSPFPVGYFKPDLNTDKSHPSQTSCPYISLYISSLYLQTVAQNHISSLKIHTTHSMCTHVAITP